MDNTPSHQQSSMHSSSNTKRDLMPPPPPRLPKRKQQEVVLEEEEWIAKLEGIIERDFFPELGKLQDKVQWLEAIRSGDPEAIRRAQLQIAQRRSGNASTPFHTTPHTRGTHQYETYNNDEQTTVEIPNMSLDAFLAQHTSEDNASFQTILDRTNKRRRERAALMYSNNDDNVKKLIMHGSSSTGTTIGNNANNTSNTTNQIKTIASSSNEKQQIVEYRINDGYGTTGQPTDTQTGWRYKPMNLFMYDGSTHDSLPLSKKERENMAQGPPRSINHKATRLHSHQHNKKHVGNDDDDSISTTTVGSVDSSIEGDSITVSESYPVGGKNLGSKKVAQHAQHGGLDPARYDILSTPSFDPGVDATPIMTWGDIGATPIRMDNDDDTAIHSIHGMVSNDSKRGFAIQDTPKREVMAHDLAVKASGSLKKRSQRSVGGGIAGIAGRGVASGNSTPLSAAAQRLAGKIQKRGGGGGGQQHRDSALRASYAGTPAQGGGGGSGWESGAATPSHGSNFGTPRGW